MKGKIIVIEGTDCSGKGTQSDLLLKSLLDEGISMDKFSFPNYNSPTGKIVGGPYLGKKHICEGFFSEGADKVDVEVGSLYYLADRKYNVPIINKTIENGTNLILDRWVESNMAHQGGKILDKEKRILRYKWLDDLEYGFFKLPRPDMVIFLHMPYEYSLSLKKNRKEAPDQHEASEEHLRNAERAYLELAAIYGFRTINCIENNKIRSIEDIHQEIYGLVIEELRKNKCIMKE